MLGASTWIFLAEKPRIQQTTTLRFVALSLAPNGRRFSSIFTGRSQCFQRHLNQKK